MFHNPAVLDGCDLLHVQAEHQKTELVLSAGYPVNEPGKADNPFRSWTENRNDSIMKNSRTGKAWRRNGSAATGFLV